MMDIEKPINRIYLWQHGDLAMLSRAGNSGVSLEKFIELMSSKAGIEIGKIKRKGMAENHVYLFSFDPVFLFRVSQKIFLDDAYIFAFGTQHEKALPILYTISDNLSLDTSSFKYTPEQAQTRESNRMEKIVDTYSTTLGQAKFFHFDPLNFFARQVYSQFLEGHKGIESLKAQQKAEERFPLSN